MGTMAEMEAWEATTAEQKALLFKEAKQLIFKTKQWSGKIKDPAGVPKTVSFFARQEEANKDFVSFLDAEILDSLYRLKRDVGRAMLPLYVAVWKLSVSIPDSDIELGEEKAIAILMRRIQGTAEYVTRFNSDPSDWHMQQRLRDRGFFRD